MVKPIRVGKITFGANAPFVLIAGPCVIESKAMAFDIASYLKDLTGKLSIPFIFKASYDKANRSSLKSFRGPGLKQGLKTLKDIKDKLRIPILSDVHCTEDIAQAARVLDIIQIPAFLCRQTDLLIRAAKTGKVINIKKGQFLAPWDIKTAAEKVSKSGNKKILITERGTSFGYNTLVSDFRAIPAIRSYGYPVVYDASHSVQQPGGLGHASGGKSEYIPVLARCAVAAGCDALFMEVHPNPKKALSDGPNMLALSKLKKLLTELAAIDRIVKGRHSSGKA